MSRNKLTSKTLVQSWLEVELEFRGKTLAEALRDLNDHLHSTYTHSRVREWEENRNGRGARLPREIRLYMAKIVMKYVLEANGIKIHGADKRSLGKIAEQLC